MREARKPIRGSSLQLHDFQALTAIYDEVQEADHRSPVGKRQPKLLLHGDDVLHRPMLEVSLNQAFTHGQPLRIRGSKGLRTAR